MNAVPLSDRATLEFFNAVRRALLASPPTPRVIFLPPRQYAVNDLGEVLEFEHEVLDGVLIYSRAGFWRSLYLRWCGTRWPWPLQ